MSKRDEIRNRTEFEARIRELQALIVERAVIFPNDTADQQLARVKEAKRDPLYFAQTYFPHYITCGFAEFHKRELAIIAADLGSGNTTIRAEAWSRGFGKSSLLAVILPIWAALTRKARFIIFVGADRELSMERTAAVRLEYLWNARLRNDFPECAMEEGNAGEEHDFVNPNNARFRAQGFKQGIRGKTHGPHRPELIIVDDLESHKDTNPKLSEQKLRYVLDEAFCAFGSQGGVLIWLGNLTHSHHALALFWEKCKAEPDNEYISFTRIVAEENGVSNWQEAFPIKKLRAIESVIGKQSYARQYLMKPGIEGDVFREEWLRFYNPYGRGVEGSRGREVEGLQPMRFPTWEELLKAPIVSYCDPSLGGGETNDYKGIITVAVWDGRYWILDVYIRKATILEMIDYQYDLDKRFPRTRHYMENNFWQKLLWDFMPQKAAEYGYSLSIAGIQNVLKKEERILKLQPMFEHGTIWHCVAGKEFNLFKEQLLGFPNAGYDDAPDALSGAIERFKEIANANRYETIERGSGGYMGMF